jgi:vacuolar protein sorting-associated protein 13A/C
MDIVKVIPRALASQQNDATVEGEDAGVQTPAAQASQTTDSRQISSTTSTFDGSEDSTVAGQKTTLDFTFSIPSINLELLDINAVSKATVQGNSIAKFRMSAAAVTYKTCSDGAIQSEVSLRSITMSNTRRGSSIFREIIPAANHDGNQL